MKAFRSWLPVVVLCLLMVAAWQYGPELAGRVAWAVEKGQANGARAELAELAKRDTLSPMLRAVAKAVRPAVVEVRVSKTVRDGDMGLDDFFRRFFDEQQGPGRRGPRVVPRQRQMIGLGSGVIVDAEKGYVITNYHVVGGAEKVEVVLSDRRVLTNEWIRSDPMTDLAVIKLAEPQGLVAAPLGENDKTDVGDLVLAIGAPSGLSQTVTMGIVSATGRGSIGATPGAYRDYIQTDAAINRGNSGGPLVNMRGEVIGINNMIVSSSGGNEGIGLAVPASMVRYVMDQLIATGKVTRGFLGVGIQDVDEKLVKSFKLPNFQGALVTNVVPDSPAAKAGVKIGDFVIAIDDTPVSSANQLRNIVASLGPSKKVKLEVFRDGEKHKIEVTFVEQPKDMAGLFAPEEDIDEVPAVKVANAFGLEVANINEELAAKYGLKKTQKGVVIIDVAEGSDAAEEGLTEGTIILRVGSQDVQTAEAVLAALKDKTAAGGVRLLVGDPKGGQRFVFIKPAKGAFADEKPAKDKEDSDAPKDKKDKPAAEKPTTDKADKPE